MLMTTKHYHTMYLGPVGFCLPALSVPPVFSKIIYILLVISHRRKSSQYSFGRWACTH